VVAVSLGTTVSLIRTGRMVVWAVVGMALLARKSLGAPGQGKSQKAEGTN